jgi:glycosyltransferase involved in cell wall biosynthesis
MPETLRILFAAPAWWPAVAFGGPIGAGRELTRRLVERGHEVEVVTTTLVDVGRRGARRTSVETVDGARVHYLATPVRYRWMGITPTLLPALERLARPDVVHVFGFRDPVTTGAATWARARRIPYVFEPLGMLQPRLRKVALKRALDATLYRGVVRGAAAVVTVSEIEARDAFAAGVPFTRVVVRGNGFPDPASIPPADGGLRRSLGLEPAAPLVLYVGRIAAGKGIEHLLEAARRLPRAHVVLLGPDDGHGTMAHVRAAQADPVTRGRVHALPPAAEPPLPAYREADLFVLASDGESFGMAAAESAAAGTPVIVTDRCGIAGFFDAGEALVVPAEREAVVAAIEQALADSELRQRLGAGGKRAAARTSWEHVVETQEAVYRRVASRTAATNPSTLGP